MKFVFATLLLLPLTGFADQPPTGATAPALRLPAIISDHMVLQADSADPIWGWAAPHSDIAIQFIDGQGKVVAEAKAKAGSDGRWLAQLPVLKTSISGKLHITAGSQSKEIADVLTGQTWLCGGQSNMSFTMSGVLDANREIAKANDPQMRLFSVPTLAAIKPQDDAPGAKWTLCTPGSLPSFSAVGYYFGKHLRSSLGQPVGLIGSYVGGTRAEVWTSIAGVKQLSSLPQYAVQYDAVAKAYPGGDDQWKKDRADFALKYGEWKKALADNTEYQAALEAWKKDSAVAKLAGKANPPMPKLPLAAPVAPLGGGAGIPSLLYNGMIAPLVPYGIRGVIWFQADGNMGQPFEYGQLIKALINDWRAQWKTELPFYYVEMNNMRDFPQKTPVILNNLSLIREQQQAALELPATGVVCSIDVGLPVPEPHFPNKKPVGDRLALLALNDLYNQKTLANSPAYKDFHIEGGKIRLRFADADGLRLIPGHEFAGFAIKGDTGDWVWAQGRIDGDSILVWNEAVPKPIAVRYAWASNPLISIENSAALPLRPFRTDTQSPK